MDERASASGRVAFTPETGLRRLRARARVLLVLHVLGWGVGLILAVAAGLGLVDYVLRTPSGLRVALLVGGLAGLAVLARRWLLPAWRFGPSLTEIALRVERSEPGRHAGLADLLASGLEFSSQPDSGAGGVVPARPGRGLDTDAARRAVSAEAERRFAALPAAGRLVSSAPAARAWGWATLVVVGVTALWVSSPRLVSIGAARVLTPWRGVEWPKRTEVADATRAVVHPLGMALPLRAALLRTTRGEGRTNVGVRYRLVEDGREGPTQRALLTSQRRRVGVDVSDALGVVHTSGELFERLLEPAALAGAGDADERFVEYWFETEDDATPPARVRLVAPPAVLSARAVVTPPAYAAGSAGSGGAGWVAGEVELGSGQDERGVVGPVLAGSSIELRLTLNKPVPAAPPRAGGAGEGLDERDQWLAGVFGTDVLATRDAGETFEAREGGRVWTLTLRPRESVRLPVSLVDEHGIAGVEDSAFSFEVLGDAPPTATITEPAQDEVVLATALVDVAAEGRDDVGLESVAIERQTARRPAGSAGAPPEGTGEVEQVVIERPGPDEQGRASRQASASARIDLSVLGLAPGDELWLRGVVQDTYALGEERHEPTRSSVRRLRIISESELIERVRDELAGIRREAIQLEGRQDELARAVSENAPAGEVARAQAGLTERLARSGEAVARLRERAERNALQDPALRGLLEGAEELLDEAGRASARAGEAAQPGAPEAGRPPDEREPVPEARREDVARAQGQVREELDELIRLLDRGEDGWAMRRSLERLLEDQRALLERTQSAGERTLGRERAELSPQELSELERIAQRQRELARQAESAIDDLAQRAEQLEKADPAGASGLSAAAQRGRAQDVPQKLNEAAQEAEANNTNESAQLQEEAIESIEEMLEDLDAGERNKDQTLKRMLASLGESIRTLIRTQEAELDALTRAGDATAGLDAGMLRLHRNTLGVIEQAGEARELAPVREPLEDAADHMVAAIGFLRGAPADPAGAGRSEQDSLAALRRALEASEKLEQEAARRDQQRQRRELRQAYREALEEQVALRGDVQPLAGRELDRRERAGLRGLGQRQDTLRANLAELLAKTEGLGDAEVFAFAHARLDRVTGSAAAGLGQGRADARLVRDMDSAVRLLQGLVEALAENPQQPEDEFREGSGGGGGGEQQAQEQPLVPDVAQLKLLRAMQGEAAELTRLADESGEADAAGVREIADLQRELAEKGRALIEQMQQQGEGGGSIPVPPQGEGEPGGGEPGEPAAAGQEAGA